MRLASVSVVIICKNAATTIGESVMSALRLTDDVVVVDSGSTDGSLAIIAQSGARLVQTTWAGFGPTKTKGNSEAKYDWILSLDADEVLSHELIASIQSLELTDLRKAFSFKRLNYLEGKPVRYGQWGRDWSLRLFNRTTVRWNEAPVHEQLLLPADAIITKLQGVLHHYTAPDWAAYKEKLERYAQLMADKYRQRGKKVQWYSGYFSSGFNFFRHYILEGGFLDGAAGWKVAKAHAGYTYKKYALLRQQASPASEKGS